MVTEVEDQQAEESASGEAVSPSARTPRFKAVTILAAIAAVVIVIDVVSKYLVTKHLTDGVSVKVVPGVIYFTLTRNGGAAFSMGTSHTFIFPLITLGVIGWIVWMGLKLRSVPWAISLGLVLGGAVGNLIDRIFRAPGVFEGHVVDFISLFNPTGRGWAIFNIADSALCCGVVLAVILELTGRRRDGGRVQG